MKKLLIILLLLSACGDSVTEIPPETYFPPISHRVVPRPVNLQNINSYVVTPNNYDEFVRRFTAENGELIFVAMSTKDFQNMSYNLNELRRYISQQKAVIVYYEKSISDLQKINTYPTNK